MKRTLVCLILGCFSLCSAQEVAPRMGDSVNVERLFKFSGTLTDSQRGFMGGTVALRFMMYSDPYQGAAYWQETQNVRPDGQGRYTVLLGEATPGGLPADVFAPGGMHWLAVQGSGQAEQPRMLLVELPSRLKPDAITSGTPVSASAMRPRGTERYITILLFMMFLLGTGLAFLEARKWWEARLDQYGPPPFEKLLSSLPSREQLRHAAEVLQFPLGEGFRAVRGRLQRSMQSVDHSMQSIEGEPPTKAA